MLPLDDTEGLRTFCTVAELGSLSAAARLMSLSPNGISRRVMRLEASLGVQLLHRTTRKVTVTTEGRLVYGRARRALDELAGLQEDLQLARGAIQGPLRVAIPGGACSIQLLRSLRTILDEHPELRVEIIVVNAVLDPVQMGFDIALQAGQPRDSQLVARRLAQVAWRLCAAPSYLQGRPKPRNPEQLIEHNCLRLCGAKPQTTWPLMTKDGTVTVVPVAGNFLADDSRVLGDATYAGLGIGVRPEKELAQAVQDGRLVRILPDYCFEPLDICALMPKGTARLKRVGKFLDVLAQALQREL